jgi:hypothetical protein
MTYHEIKTLIIIYYSHLIKTTQILTIQFS